MYGGGNESIIGGKCMPNLRRITLTFRVRNYLKSFIDVGSCLKAKSCYLL